MSTLQYTKPTLQNHANIAADWLLNSKIHNNNSDDKNLFGSFNNYLDLGSQKCEYAYTEITGYSIELLLDLYQKNGAANLLEVAKQVANWVRGMQYAGALPEGNGGYLYCVNLEDMNISNEAYSFDAGICLGGLTRLYEVTKDAVYHDSASKAANWLTKVMQNPDGSFKSLCDVQKDAQNATRQKNPIPASIRKSWFFLPGCHHGKIAIGLSKYYLLSKDESILNSVSSLCNWLISQQSQNGYFRVAVNTDVSFSHTHCYAVEGLLFAANLLKDTSILKSGKLGGDWLIKLQKNDGRISAWTNNNWPMSYTDISAVAQSIRIWCVLYSETDDKKYLNAINKSLSYLLKMQHITKDLAQSGGFHLAELDFKLTKHKLDRLYSWATMFAVHALNLSSEVLERKISGTELW
jgi:rhamnogalacturonyl hydrolase YesR